MALGRSSLSLGCLNPGCARASYLDGKRERGITKIEVPQYNAYTQRKEISNFLTRETVTKVIALSMETDMDFVVSQISFILSLPVWYVLLVPSAQSLDASLFH